MKDTPNLNHSLWSSQQLFLLPLLTEMNTEEKPQGLMKIEIVLADPMTLLKDTSSWESSSDGAICPQMFYNRSESDIFLITTKNGN